MIEWIIGLVLLGLFVYFVPYKNIKLIQTKLDKIIEKIEKLNG